MKDNMNRDCDFAREVMTALGAREIEPDDRAGQVLMNAARIDLDGWERDFPEVANPIGEGMVALRTVLMPSMLVALGGCRLGKLEAVRTFEIGYTYSKNYLIPTAEPFKSRNLSFGAYGEGENMERLRDTVTVFLRNMGISEMEFVPEPAYGTYAADQCERIVTRDNAGQEVELGIMGKFHREVVENFYISCDAYGAELFLDLIIALTASANRDTEAEAQAAPAIDAAILSEETARLEELERQISAFFATDSL